jgi:predicted CXXCH cytochrome family protein
MIFVIRILMMNRKVLRSCVVLLPALAIFLVAEDSQGARRQDAIHLNRDNVLEGCAACHRGRGAPGTALLRAHRENLCFICHGAGDRSRASTDIESEFNKRSVHPVQSTAHYHWFGEVMPEENPSQPRHVSCYDCHSVHVLEEGKPMKGKGGYAPTINRQRGRFGGPPPGRRIQEIEDEYQLCYVCHSDSANLPEETTNKAIEFDTTNESFHPVELPGKNSRVPSLIIELSVTSTIKCSDCHGSGDARGSQGVHGSRYSPLLVARYITTDGREDPRSYMLCYMCHDRRSILKDESFQRHNLHTVSKQTACFTCHDAHGSVDNEHLIKFNEEVVGPSDVDGGPEYITGTSGRPKCYLKCHDIDHNNSGIGENSWPW